jgi:hypothetical protein
VVYLYLSKKGLIRLKERFTNRSKAPRRSCFLLNLSKNVISDGDDEFELFLVADLPLLLSSI